MCISCKINNIAKKDIHAYNGASEIELAWLDIEKHCECYGGGLVKKSNLFAEISELFVMHGVFTNNSISF